MHKALALVVLVPTLAAGYFLIPKDGPQRFLLTGSSTLAPVLQQVAEDLHAADGTLEIDVETGGSSRGIQDARLGLCNVGMASRDLKEEEALGLDPRVVALDGVALVVNASNPVAALDRQQVIDLYTGKTDDWSELGGDEGEIHVVSKAEGRATLTVFLEHFGLKNSQIVADAVIGDNAQGVRIVAGNPLSIAYVSIGEALAAVERGEDIHLVALDGVAPTRESVANGAYSLRRNLYLLFPGAPDEIGEKILAHLSSERGRAILGELGFTPVDLVQ